MLCRSFEHTCVKNWCVGPYLHFLICAVNLSCGAGTDGPVIARFETRSRSGVQPGNCKVFGSGVAPDSCARLRGIAPGPR